MVEPQTLETTQPCNRNKYADFCRLLYSPFSLPLSPCLQNEQNPPANALFCRRYRRDHWYLDWSIEREAVVFVFVAAIIHPVFADGITEH